MRGPKATQVSNSLNMHRGCKEFAGEGLPFQTTRCYLQEAGAPRKDRCIAPMCREVPQLQRRGPISRDHNARSSIHMSIHMHTVNMHTCMCGFMYVYASTHAHIHCACVYIPMYVNTYAYTTTTEIYIHMYMHICVCLFSCLFLFRFVCGLVNMPASTFV